MIQFTVLNMDTQQVDFVLHYSPDWAVPFIIESGEQGHIFNWDMVTGSLLMDGAPITRHTITIERVLDANVEVQ